MNLRYPRCSLEAKRLVNEQTRSIGSPEAARFLLRFRYGR